MKRHCLIYNSRSAVAMVKFLVTFRQNLSCICIPVRFFGSLFPSRDPFASDDLRRDDDSAGGLAFSGSCVEEVAAIGIGGSLLRFTPFGREPDNKCSKLISYLFLSFLYLITRRQLQYTIRLLIDAI